MCVRVYACVCQLMCILESMCVYVWSCACVYVSQKPNIMYVIYSLCTLVSQPVYVCVCVCIRVHVRVCTYLRSSLLLIQSIYVHNLASVYVLVYVGYLVS